MTGAIRLGGLPALDLDGRVAVVAGGSGGIGAASARLLAGQGARLAVGYNRNREGAETLVRSLGDGHIAVAMPAEDSAALERGAQSVGDTFGRCDILVNAGGISSAVPHADLDALTDDMFDRILRVNVRGCFATIRAFAPLLRASGDGVVVNISSISATTGLGSSIAYCAAKAAVDTMGLSLARVLAPEVRVLTVSPAAVATDFVPGRGRAGVEKQAATTPLGIVAEPEDVAQAVYAAIAYLRLSTGTTLVIDSGRHL